MGEPFCEGCYVSWNVRVVRVGFGENVTLLVAVVEMRLVWTLVGDSGGFYAR